MMKPFEIVSFPHPVLRHPCKPIVKIDAELRSIVARMFELMYEHEGIGLAANQIGLPLQLFVLNITGDKTQPEEEHVFINPVLRKQKGREEDSEGCLSFPEIRGTVIRPSMIEIEGISLDGTIKRHQWKGLHARAAQHEMDHLLGVSFVDRISITSLAEVREQLLELDDEFENSQRAGSTPGDEAIAEQIQFWEQKYCEVGERK
ncbi:MAG: peptide deformylase [Thermoguttaceae bacterium]